jgi:hypothetical protein
VCLFPFAAAAALNISLDADGRYNLIDWKDGEAVVNLAGLSVRKTLADGNGDRFVIFCLAEAERNFSRVMIHESYLRLKGPMGAWNMTIGRFGVPFGLLNNFNTSRQLYKMPHSVIIGIDADNGIMLSGTAGLMDYAVSLTQGYGHHHVPALSAHGFAVFRIGMNFGDAEEIVVGVSGAAGRTSHEHERDMFVRRAAGGTDATLYLGRFLLRTEFNAGMSDLKPVITGFAGCDYALLSNFDVTAAVTLSLVDDRKTDKWFVGAAFKHEWFTIRGGYSYAYYNAPGHEVSVQIYRLFFFTF